MSSTDTKDQTTCAPQQPGLRPDPAGGWRLSAGLVMRDQPGELAELASFMAEHKANIERFDYNRSQAPNRVCIEVRCNSAAAAGLLADELHRLGRLDQDDTPAPAPDSTDPITSLDGVLSIKATLEDTPGTLADLAELFRTHEANVIHMAYDGDAAPGLAEITMVTRSPEQVSALLGDLGKTGLHFTVQFSGADGSHADSIIDELIGLSAIEQFLFKLKTILPPDKLDRLKTIIESSDEMGRALLDFRREAGESEESMAVSEVFANILHLAAASIGKTGEHFSMRLTGPMTITENVSLYMLACPTGANGYLLRTDDEDVLMDSGYGLYYPDVRDWLSAHGFDPKRIKRAYITHPDADHAGLAAPLHEEFGTEIFMHPDAAQVFSNDNRAHNTGTRLQALNVSFTKLITRLTELRGPASISEFERNEDLPEQAGGFPVMGSFMVGDVQFWVLESLGGHVAGQVFFYAPDQGLLFCGDYLIDVPSLSERDKRTLSVPKYLMTSTNSDSRVFSEEMMRLRGLMTATNRKLAATGKPAWVFSGHGGLYTVDEAGWPREES